MRIVFDRPPMFDEINAKFRIAGKPVIFSWGDLIYNPMRVFIPPHLLAHEAVHGRRQLMYGALGGGIDDWWREYINSAAFRLNEEIPAHQAEYAALMRQNNNRHARRGHLKRVAKRLSAPLYGGMITTAKARGLILAPVNQQQAA